MDIFHYAVERLEQFCFTSPDPGLVSIALYAGDSCLVKNFPAFASAHPQSETQPEPVFLIYSLTKSVIAATALRLVANGELALDTPIAQWMPQAPHARQITVRQLLQHTSGLPDYGHLSQYHQAVRQGQTPWSPAVFLAQTGAEERLLFEPGAQFAYSNIGYMLLGQLLETIRATSLSSIVQREIFQPLQLKRAFLPSTPEDLKPLALGASDYLGTSDTARHYHPGWVAHQVIAAPAREVATFYHGLLSGQLLPLDLLKTMQAPNTLPQMPGRPWRQPGYGLGLQVDSGYPPNTIYGHTGGGPGASACVCAVRLHQKTMVVVVLASHENVTRVEEMAHQLATVFLEPSE